MGEMYNYHEYEVVKVETSDIRKCFTRRTLLHIKRRSYEEKVIKYTIPIELGEGVINPGDRITFNDDGYEDRTFVDFDGDVKHDAYSFATIWKDKRTILHVDGRFMFKLEEMLLLEESRNAEFKIMID